MIKTNPCWLAIDGENYLYSRCKDHCNRFHDYYLKIFHSHQIWKVVCQQGQHYDPPVHPVRHLLHLEISKYVMLQYDDQWRKCKPYDSMQIFIRVASTIGNRNNFVKSHSLVTLSWSDLFHHKNYCSVTLKICNQWPHKILGCDIEGKSKTIKYQGQITHKYLRYADPWEGSSHQYPQTHRDFHQQLYKCGYLLELAVCHLTLAGSKSG